MGKSRLVYEFTKQMHVSGWQIERFEACPSKGSAAKSIDALDAWHPEILRTIVVLDDVQAHMEMVKRWLNRVARCPRSEKLCILLLERDGKDLNSVSWLGAEPCDEIPSEWCYDEKFLCLAPMTDGELITIMDTYATASRKKPNAELLLKTLERVDPKLKRPMYAIAIADARCQGKDPTNWDWKKVLDTLLERELGFYFNRLKGMIGKKPTKTLHSEFEELLARSCVRGFLFLKDAEMDRYPTLVKKIEDLDMDCQEYLESLGILRTVLIHSITLDESGNPIGEPEQEKPRKAIALSCPDLIKEHLVLNLALEGSKRGLLFPQGWEQDPGQLSFLTKLLVDYSDRLTEQSDYWDTFFRHPQDVLPVRIYGGLLWGYTAKYSDRARAAVDRLARLYDEIAQNPEIAKYYVCGLFNLSTEQNLAERSETVEELKKLYQSHSGSSKLAVIYAKGLVNLAAEQDLVGCTETVKQLGALCQSHSDISEVAVSFAVGHVNLISKQNLEGGTDTVKRLEALYQIHCDNPEIAAWLICGLLNLSNKQVPACRMQTIAQCEKIYTEHPDWEKVAAKFAYCLVNLAFYQESESEVCGTLACSHGVLDRYPENSDIQLSYAKTWFNLTLQQNDADIPATIADIADFLRSHPGAIPPFKEALDEYLSDHPNHAVRYSLLRSL